MPRPHNDFMGCAAPYPRSPDSIPALLFFGLLIAVLIFAFAQSCGQELPHQHEHPARTQLYPTPASPQ